MIFCVEDDAGIREIEVYTLRSTGFEAEGFADGEALFAALADTVPELILLDVMLPGEDGISLLRRLKASSATAAVPVIMATAKTSEYDKVTGLDSGADDYLAKPFGMMEMVSRVRAVLRRAGTGARPRRLAHGELCMDLDKHEVTSGGAPVPLTLKEFELLRRLMERPGYVFDRDMLLSDIWGQDYDGETRTVDVHIRTLRQKLGSAGELIETVRGVGYRLGGSV